MTVQFQFIRTTHENGRFDKLNAGSFDKLNAGSFDKLNAGSFDRLNAGDFDRLNAGDFDRLNAGRFDKLNAGDFTHLNAGDFDRLSAGGWRSFSPEALTFWQQHGSVVGAVLRPETPLTFAQILTACREYAHDHIADGPQPELVPGYVAWVLVHLVGYGLAATIPASPAPPIQKLNWTAVYPAAAEATYAAAADQQPASQFPSHYGQNRH